MCFGLEKKTNFFLLFRMSVIFRENNAFEDANKESGLFCLVLGWD